MIIKGEQKLNSVMNVKKVYLAQKSACRDMSEDEFWNYCVKRALDFFREIRFFNRRLGHFLLVSCINNILASLRSGLLELHLPLNRRFIPKRDTP